MDGSDADGEWSEGDNEEEMVRSDMATDEEGEENGIDEEDEDGEDEEQENGVDVEDAGEVSPKKQDYADYIMDNIDAELHHIISKGIEPETILLRAAARKHLNDALKQREEYDASDNDEKTVSVLSSQRLTSDAGTADTGLGSGSLLDDYASSDMENIELPKHDERMTVADSEIIRQVLRERLEHRPKDPIPSHLRSLRRNGGRNSDGGDSVRTEDYENQFHTMMIKQLAGVPITSFDDVAIASDVDSVRTGEIHRAIQDSIDGSKYERHSESDVDSDRMEDFDRKFQVITTRRKKAEQYDEHVDSDDILNALDRLQALSLMMPGNESHQLDTILDDSVDDSPPLTDVSALRTTSKAKTPTKKTTRKTSPSKKPLASKSVEKMTTPRAHYAGTQLFNGSFTNGGRYDEDDMDGSLVDKVEALINRRKKTQMMSPRSLSVSMPNVSLGHSNLDDLLDDDSGMESRLHDLESGVRDASARKQIALKELRVVQEALKRNRSDAKNAEKSTHGLLQKTENLKSECMVLEFQRDQARRELKDMEEDIANRKQTIRAQQQQKENFRAQQQQKEKAKPKPDDTGMTAAEILSIVKERDDLRTRVRNGEAEMSRLERSELERQLSATKEELFNEQKKNRAKVDAMQEEMEDTKHRLEDSECARQQLADKVATLQANVEALQAESHKQLQEKKEIFDGVKERLGKDLASTRMELEQRNRRVLSLEKDMAEKEMVNRALQERLIELQAEMQQETYAKERLIDEKERLFRASQTEMEMTLNNLREDFEREKAQELLELKNKMERERRDEMAKQEDKIAEQMAESQQNINAKDDELEMVRDRLRQQEDATRNLGEKMRLEAKEQIRSAIDKEREIWEKEMERHLSREQEAWEEEAVKASSKLKEDIDHERQLVLQQQNTISSLREEMEGLRQEVRSSHREKIDAVTKSREASRKEKQAELDKLRDKLTQEKMKDVDKLREKLRSQDDELIQLRSDVRSHAQKEKEIMVQSERHEKSLIMEINEECKKTTNVTGGTPRKVPVTSSKSDRPPSVNGSPTKSPKLGRSPMKPQVSQAMSNLKSTNEELRLHLQDMRRELEKEKKNSAKVRKEKEADLKRLRVQLDRGKNGEMEALRDRLVKEHLEELNKLQKAVGKDDSTLHREIMSKDNELKEIARNMNHWKEETAQKMARKFEEELNKEVNRRMKESSRKMETMFKSQLSDQQRQIEKLERDLRRARADQSSASFSSSASQNSETSTIRLLRHLQERVKHLREENMALRRSGYSMSGQSDSGTMEDLTPLASSGMEMSEDGSTTSQLEHRVKSLERQLREAQEKSRKNSSLLNHKITEITKLQSALTHQTKEVMKLERAYAKVQSELSSASMR